MGTRKFRINEKDYVFNFINFKKFFREKADHKIGDYEREIADALNVSEASIHAWRNNSNGPGDIEIIKNLAEHWNIDFMILLTEEKEIMVKELTERQRDSVARIYKAISDFMIVFEESGGMFACFPRGFEKFKTVDEQVEYADTEYMKIRMICNAEYCNLGKHPIYEELYDFVEDSIPEMYAYDDKCDSKMKFSYRQFYNDATEEVIIYREKLNAIIDKYI